jgi:hypothetical protein
LAFAAHGPVVARPSCSGEHPNQEPDMTPTLTLTQLKRLKPCQDSLKRVARFLGDVPLTASEARAAGATFDDIAWASAAASL